MGFELASEERPVLAPRELVGEVEVAVRQQAVRHRQIVRLVALWSRGTRQACAQRGVEQERDAEEREAPARRWESAVESLESASTHESHCKRARSHHDEDRALESQERGETACEQREKRCGGEEQREQGTVRVRRAAADQK